MKCGYRIVGLSVVLCLLLVAVLYVVFGSVHRGDHPVSVMTILHKMTFQSFNKAAENSEITTTPEPKTTTESVQARLMFQKEYNRIENNLQNGRQAHQNGPPIDQVAQRFDLSDAQQHFPAVMKNRNTWHHLVNAVPQILDDHLKHINDPGSRPGFPRLHVKPVAEVHAINNAPGNIPVFIAPGQGDTGNGATAQGNPAVFHYNTNHQNVGLNENLHQQDQNNVVGGQQTQQQIPNRQSEWKNMNTNEQTQQQVASNAHPGQEIQMPNGQLQQQQQQPAQQQPFVSNGQPAQQQPIVSNSQQDIHHQSLSSGIIGQQQQNVDGADVQQTDAGLVQQLGPAHHVKVYWINSKHVKVF